MPSDPAMNLSELELDALWTIYEGHSLIVERPQRADVAPYANAIMAVAYEDDEAVAEVAEIPLETVESLVADGFLVLSEDGPVLDENAWFDDELDCEVVAEEYVLSARGQRVIDATADGDLEDDDPDEGSEPL